VINAAEVDLDVPVAGIPEIRVAWGEEAAERHRRSLAPFLSEAPARMRVRGGLVRVPAEARDGVLCLDDVELHPGEIIAKELSGIEAAAAFLVTLGPAYDDWITGLFDGGDPFGGYAAASIGSLAVEAAADRLEDHLRTGIAPEGLGATNRFSPGYCGWDVGEQEALFKVFPNEFCGVRLTSSSFMVPVKSVSGILGLGPGLEPGPYPCGTCTREECHRRGSK
jgi:hypothetical protein